MKFKTIVVLLVRSQNSKIPLIVAEHEIPILKLLHGGENEDLQDGVIEYVDIEPPVLYIEAVTMDEEYSRLKNFYLGNENLPNPTRAVYPTLKSFSESVIMYVEPKTKKVVDKVAE